ncbi:MAG: di-trans,poly-cis-decaprenylcistransferase [Lachnospiraceae bacterium]|nr:di-trans,poly-cis-decaprenylcistransferase [Lachnospiraceae bacterium]
MANVPEHLAIILDGNGRWAKKKGLPRNAGHVAGARVLEDMCEVVWDKGIKYFTVYAFSTENWNRPSDEVAALMKLLRDYMKNSVKRAMKNNLRVRVIGDKSGLDEDLQDSIRTLEEATELNTGLNFTIALNYGGRDEIVRAVRKLASEKDIDFMRGLTDKDLSCALDTAGMPDPDLLIRTCAEERISNFLLWQLAYSEFYFADVAWPDFNEAELDKALESYASRTRRFGGLVKGEE